MGDKHTNRAKREGLRARSAFKLESIEQKYHIFKGAKLILDLGAWPGGWSIIASRFAKVIAVDLERINPIPNVECIQGDLFNDALVSALPSVDVVLSDAAPNTTGKVELDQHKSYLLALRCFEIAKFKLRIGGHFVCKVFQGEDFDAFLADLKTRFTFVKATKPTASKKGSKEMYIVAMQFKI